MRTGTILAAAWCLVAAQTAPSPTPAAPTAPAATTAGEARAPAERAGAVKYQIGAGDVLTIHVWKEPEASAPEAVVRSDGRISLPIVKEVDVLGLTPTQLEALLTEKFSQYILEPQVTVLVKTVNSEKIYLVGAVKKEGSVRYQPPMTILQALAEGGGLTDFAKKKKIHVIRTVNGKQVRLPFNYDAATKGEKDDQNFLMWPGDTIVIPH
jgi:polysaccharide export outer membrane protein